MVTLGWGAKRVLCSVDWGFTNPGVLQVWVEDGDGRLYRVHEVYRTQRTIDYWIGQAKRVKEQFKPEVFVCDPSEPAYISQFQAAGLNAIGGYNEVAPGIQAVQQRLRAAGDGRPRIFFLRDATTETDPRLVEAKKPLSTEQEFDGYIWATSPDGRPVKEEPVKVDDHGMDATRYLVAYVDKLGDVAPPASIWDYRRAVAR